MLKKIGLRISIHAAREGGDGELRKSIPAEIISIHAAREGGDPCQPLFGFRFAISIHAAREGGDVLRSMTSGQSSKFQSTPPVKAATVYVLSFRHVLCNFNPRRP